jgi:hypothetical protein
MRSSAFLQDVSEQQSERLGYIYSPRGHLSEPLSLLATSLCLSLSKLYSTGTPLQISPSETAALDLILSLPVSEILSPTYPRRPPV